MPPCFTSSFNCDSYAKNPDYREAIESLRLNDGQPEISNLECEVAFTGVEYYKLNGLPFNTQNMRALATDANAPHTLDVYQQKILFAVYARYFEQNHQGFTLKIDPLHSNAVLLLRELENASGQIWSKWSWAEFINQIRPGECTTKSVFAELLGEGVTTFKDVPLIKTETENRVVSVTGMTPKIAGSPWPHDLKLTDVTISFGQSLPITSDALIPKAPKKFTVVNLWTTWCAPCVAERSMWSQVSATTLADLQIINMSFDDKKSEEKLKALIQSRPVFGAKEFSDAHSEIADYFSVNQFPVTLIIDANGIITAFHSGAVTPEWVQNILKGTIDK